MDMADEAVPFHELLVTGLPKRCIEALSAGVLHLASELRISDPSVTMESERQQIGEVLRSIQLG
jgi:hypothetical protein